MARILITSGPTRQYLDPVRYLTNASSGRMGVALAHAAIARGHDIVIVSGPIQREYPSEASVVPITSTEDMLAACREVFPDCNGLIGAAAPCDYRPVKVEPNKIAKTGEPLHLHLIETPDVVATLASEFSNKWLVGFALETEDHRFRALAKMQKKSCDLMVLNGPTAISSEDNDIEILDRDGEVVSAINADKEAVAVEILRVIQERLIRDTQ